MSSNSKAQLALIQRYVGFSFFFFLKKTAVDNPEFNMNVTNDVLKSRQVIQSYELIRPAG